MGTGNSSRPGVRLGIIGIGAMGKGLLYQSHITPGVNCVAVCDIDVRKCIETLTWLDLPFQMVNDPEGIRRATAQGQIAVCTDGGCIAGSDVLDVVLDASTSVGSAGEWAVRALQTHKHVVLMNSEVDLTFGPFLSEVAARNGVICTSCDGDQHGVLKHLIDDIRSWGFQLVMAGNIKGFLDMRANPTTIVPEAVKRNLDFRMCTSFTDGTKLNIEMAIIANACGLNTRTPGMFGPAMDNVREVFDRFDFDQLWCDRTPFVDYILGAQPDSGVFVIGHCDNSYQKSMLSYYKMGPGPYYLFYRPYHLCHIEAINTVLKAVSNECLLHPSHGFLTNVFAYAKTDLHAGQTLDGIGGYTCYGKIENCADNGLHTGIPICLAHDVVLKRPTAKDERVLMRDIEYDPERSDFRLFQKALQASEKLRGDKK